MNAHGRVAIAALVLLAVPVHGAPPEGGEATNLRELLGQIREGNRRENEENARREAEFRSQKEERQRLLTKALAAKQAAESRSARLEAAFEANEARIPELAETLRTRQGTLGELFGVVRQVAGDTRAQIESSIISAQLPGRTELLGKLAQSRELPSIDDLEALWFSLQEEMTESGRVVRFPATVIAVGGGATEEEVVRVGSFNTVANGRYLQYLPETGKLAELGRQPRSRDLRTVDALEAAKSGIVGFSIDPSRGSILSLLIQTPSREERIDQGGPIGYVTIALGIVGFLIALYRIAYLGWVGRKVRRQVGADQASTDNPLGRVLAVYEKNRVADLETVELRLDEAIARETPLLEGGAPTIKVLSVVAPLLGLLGTVTGMIATFQAITLFGTGDPKLMASGIAEALVTTMIGLMVAIPLTLFHSFVSTKSKKLIQILEEQSIGLIALHAEEQSEQGERGRALAG